MPTSPNPYDPANWIVRAEITLVGIEPVISRTLELPRTLNLAELHEVLQAAFGWTDSHLHQFDIGGLIYGAPEHDEGYEGERRTFEATDVHLSDFVFRHDQPIIVLYEYDFGDSWIHRLIMTLKPRDAAEKYPRCVAGARSAPPEDAGGPHSYADLVEAWTDKAHEEHAAIRKWTGRRFDPNRFDLTAANKLIASALRRAKGDYRHRHVGR